MTESTPKTETNEASTLDKLSEKRGFLGIVVAVLGLCFAIFPIVLLSKRGFDHAFNPVFFWGCYCAAVSVVLGLLIRAEPLGTLSATNNVRVLLMTWGSLIGIGTVLLGLALPFSEDYKAVLAGGLKQWRESPQGLIWTGLAFFGGLAVLFWSVMLARGVERESGWMRRLLYGYNAVLSSLLLLAVLLLINVLVYVKIAPFSLFNRQFDWTAAQVYSIAPSTENLLEKLDTPVKVYIMGLGTLAVKEAESLLQTCRLHSKHLTWKVLSIDEDRGTITEFITKYNLTEAQGLLVVYGVEPNQSHVFLGIGDLFPRDVSSPRDQPQFDFAGEAALNKAISYLMEGRAIPVHFLQGHGELDFGDSTPTRRTDVGLGMLVDRLRQSNYDPRPLELSPDNPKIGKEVEILVIARPRQIPEKQGDAIRDFVQGKDRAKPGQLIVMLDVIKEKDKMAETGLEGLLADHSVRVENERVIGIGGPKGTASPLELLGLPDRRSRSTIAQAFSLDPSEPTLFWFDDVRPVTEISPTNPRQAPPYQVDPIVVLPLLEGVWTESNLSKDPTTEAKFYDANRAALRGKLRQPNVAVSVSKREAPVHMRDPHDFSANTKPVMVVFGDASFVSNAIIAGKYGEENYGLFKSSLSWLKGKPDLGEAPLEPKKRKLFVWTASEDVKDRTMYLPGYLMIVGVLGLGVGVWVVRRR